MCEVKLGMKLIKDLFEFEQITKTDRFVCVKKNFFAIQIDFFLPLYTMPSVRVVREDMSKFSVLQNKILYYSMRLVKKRKFIP